MYYYELKLLPSIGTCGIGFSRASDKSACKVTDKAIQTPQKQNQLFTILIYSVCSRV